MTPYVFLDRDGTLTVDRGYIHRIEDFALLPGVVEGLRALSAAGFGLAIVTNQSGIARGYFDEAAYGAFQAHLKRELATAGVAIAGSYHCPHGPDAGCRCRKPAPGLVLDAAAALGADLARSWVIGNAERDAEAGLQAGCGGAVLIGVPPSVASARVSVARDFEAAAAHVLHPNGSA
jgi:D-glycero-D-manno-heptose 1,7-bisphosphate phosphatase